MTATTGAAAIGVASVTAGPLSVIAGPLSAWSVLVVVGWLLVMLFVWVLLAAHGRRSSG
ncbi:hypothetical protein [Halorussus amylolyticus]|uniref:hypothetical protein n=1 Tax=Halorussus amylolyticus TaxID=1126242 RepID=UPI00138F7894|nr:hypothetical protein [Halorussus amylolyticus]